MRTFAILAILVAPNLLSAQDSVFEKKVEEAREKGVDFLTGTQQADGSWDYEGHEVGITALCTLALVENGLSPTDDVVRKGVDFVRDAAPGLTNTYDIALAIVLLTKIGSRKDSDRIKGLAASLLAGQTTTGGWSYGCPKGTKAMLQNPRLWPKRKVHPGDNSCTQFAVLGLWVASREDVEIEDAMAGVARRFVYYQNDDGGWGYRLPTAPAEGDPAPVDGEATVEPSKNSMTFAGLFCLTVARATRIRAEKEAEERGRKVTTEAPKDVVIGDGSTPFKDAGSEAKTLFEDPIFKKGLEQAGRYARGIGNGSAMYFMWSAERIGVMLGMEEIGGTNWFAKAAAAMLATQKTDGSWGGGHGEFASTAFAILVLRKANLGSDITRLLEGEPKQSFGIVGQEKRFDTLKDAIAAAEPGATIRIEGDGPFPMPHFDIDRDLTLQAGFGYQPVFQYDVGFDEFGVRTRPENDEFSRHMIRATKGTLVLEGLKLEMDPPFTTKKDLDWTAVVADGGELRILNCTITESNKRGVVAIRLLKPGKHVIRNSVLGTTISAIFVNGAGKTDLTVDNCILFSDVAVDLRQDTEFKGDSSARIVVRNSTVQAREALRFLSLPTFPIAVEFDGNMVQADALVTYLASAGKGTDRTWTGGGSTYNVTSWVAVKRKPVTAVRDLKSWRKFWDIEEEGSSDRLASFTIRRPLASFSHRMRPEDWDLTDERREAGVYALTVGIGRGFSRFRSTIRYNLWMDDEGEASVAGR